jgi:hypothetical protein
MHPLGGPIRLHYSRVCIITVCFTHYIFWCIQIMCILEGCVLYEGILAGRTVYERRTGILSTRRSMKYQANNCQGRGANNDVASDLYCEAFKFQVSNLDA